MYKKPFGRLICSGKLRPGTARNTVNEAIVGQIGKHERYSSGDSRAYSPPGNPVIIGTGTVTVYPIKAFQTVCAGKRFVAAINAECLSLW